jgi:hypothetical protein
METELSDLYLYKHRGNWVERPWVPEELLDDMTAAGVVRGYMVEHVTGLPRWGGWTFRLVRHPVSGRIVRFLPTPPAGHTPRRDERRALHRFRKMIEESQRWQEGEPGDSPGQPARDEGAAFLAMLLPTPNHGHDRAEAAETVKALCRFAEHNDLEWRLLLAATYGVTGRTVDSWMAEAHDKGLERLRRPTRRRPTRRGSGGPVRREPKPTRSHSSAEQTLTAVFTPILPFQSNAAGEQTCDVEIAAHWSDGKAADTFERLRAVTLAETVAEQVRLTKELEQRHPRARVRSTLAKPTPGDGKRPLARGRSHATPKVHRGCWDICETAQPNG